MSSMIESTMQKTNFVAQPTYDDYVKTDEAARAYALEWKS
jgi:hypothetical protein